MESVTLEDNKTVVKKRNVSIDLYKIALAWFVILIHAGHFTSPNNFWLYAIRIAVPGFLIVSGFFFFKEDVTSDEDLAKRAFKFFLTSLKYTLIAFLTVMLLEIIFRGFILHNSIADMFNTWFSGDYFRSIFVTNWPVNDFYGYHLWYLIAATVAYLILYILFKLKLKKVVFFLPLLFLGFFFFSLWLKYVPGQSTVVPASNTRNAFFMVLPGIAIGYDLAYLRKFKIPWWTALIVGAAGVGFFLLQYREAKHYDLGVPETTVSAVLAASCFVFALDFIPRFGGKIYNILVGKNIAFFIYVYHVPIYRFLYEYYKIEVKDNLAIKTFLVAIGSYFVIHFLYILIMFAIEKLKFCFSKNRSEEA